ncbi:hypothetical protein ACXIUX_22730 [Vibrio parahaemolyticus]|uniref:hypothetical protein n=1 Tax=Vibrio parahaemolyticus TaxID=670 RepID=UPI0028F6D1BF|nr:hypothetical protein [Vibrio parahaemolyticus]
MGTGKDFLQLLDKPEGKMVLNVMETNGSKVNTINAHLIFEELLTELLRTVFCENDGIERAKLQFHQKLHLVNSLKSSKLPPHLYGALKKLNKIRNCYAHSLNPQGVNELESDLISIVPSSQFPIKAPFQLGNHSIEQGYDFQEKYVIALRWIFSELMNITKHLRVIRNA